MKKEEQERVINGETVWQKNKARDHISWKHNNEDNMVFRFDDEPEKEYYLYRDYSELDAAHKRIFDRENPFWKKFFSGDI